MNISILIVTNDFEKWIENFKESFHNGTSYYYLSAGKEIEIRFYLTDKVTEHIVRGRKINHVVLDKKIDEEESRLIQISLIGNEVRKTDNWFNESDYKGTPVYTIEEIKFDPKRAIYALEHQGTSENLNLIFWDGNVWRHLGTVNRPVYSFGKTTVEIETKGKEDWLARIKKEKKSKPTVNSPEFTVKVDLTTLSAGIDDYIQSQLNRDWLNQS